MKKPQVREIKQHVRNWCTGLDLRDFRNKVINSNDKELENHLALIFVTLVKDLCNNIELQDKQIRSKKKKDHDLFVEQFCEMYRKLYKEEFNYVWGNYNRWTQPIVKRLLAEGIEPARYITWVFNHHFTRLKTKHIYLMKDLLEDYIDFQKMF